MDAYLQKKIDSFEAQRNWMVGRIKDVQDNFEYANINIRIEKGNLTVFKCEKTELVPKNIINK